MINKKKEENKGNLLLSLEWRLQPILKSLFGWYFSLSSGGGVLNSKDVKVTDNMKGEIIKGTLTTCCQTLLNVIWILILLWCNDYFLGFIIIFRSKGSIYAKAFFFLHLTSDHCFKKVNNLRKPLFHMPFLQAKINNFSCIKLLLLLSFIITF